MKRALILGVMLFALVGVGEPATKPSELKFGGVRVRADAPPAVIGYFEIITAREKAVVDALAEIEGWMKNVQANTAKEAPAERGKHMRKLREGIEAGKKMLADIRRPDYRPQVGDKNRVRGSKTVYLHDEIRIDSVHSETTAMIQAHSTSYKIGLAREILGEFNGETFGEYGIEGGFEDTQILRGKVDREWVKVSKPIVRDGTFQYAASDGMRTVPKYRLMTEDPEVWVVK